jgi:hypothetical protein
MPAFTADGMPDDVCATTKCHDDSKLAGFFKLQFDTSLCRPPKLVNLPDELAGEGVKLGRIPVSRANNGGLRH